MVNKIFGMCIFYQKMREIMGKMLKKFKDITLQKKQEKLALLICYVALLFFGILNFKIFLHCPELPTGHSILIVLVKKNFD